MERHTFAMEVKPGRMGDFRGGLGKVWPELTAALDERGIKNFSIWNVERIVFGYFETEDGFCFSEEDEKKAAAWEKLYKDSYAWIATPFQGMRLMYQDFGIVRESKELIRHRVFITKLVPGTEEEYKARHDALVEQRHGKITEGPDSNFSIWNAGGYIFGYNEIDTTMEGEVTEEERANTIAWEKRMLEIMSWLTDDVDWITGERHEHIKRLCFHNS